MASAAPAKWEVGAGRGFLRKTDGTYRYATKLNKKGKQTQEKNLSSGHSRKGRSSFVSSCKSDSDSQSLRLSLLNRNMRLTRWLRLLQQFEMQAGSAGSAARDVGAG